MEKEKISADSLKLRRLAEKDLKDTPDGHEDLSGMSPEDKTSLIHELRVHQIELKMQNEELRRIQGELERTRDRYSHLYDFAPAGYFTGTEKGIITEANLTIASMLGTERSALIGKPFTHFILNDDQSVYYKHRQRLMETEAPHICELRLVKKDGHLFYARLDCMVVKNSGAHLRQIRAAVSDITERKLAQEQRDKLIAELQKTLSEVKTLRGFLPICANCKNIRDDKGYWNQIESYIRDRSDAEFSHSICPDCANKLYTDMDLCGEDKSHQ